MKGMTGEAYSAWIILNCRWCRYSQNSCKQKGRYWITPFIRMRHAQWLPWNISLTKKCFFFFFAHFVPYVWLLLMRLSFCDTFFPHPKRRVVTSFLFGVENGGKWIMVMFLCNHGACKVSLVDYCVTWILWNWKCTVHWIFMLACAETSYCMNDLKNSWLDLPTSCSHHFLPYLSVWNNLWLSALGLFAATPEYFKMGDVSGFIFTLNAIFQTCA